MTLVNFVWVWDKRRLHHTQLYGPGSNSLWLKGHIGPGCELCCLWITAPPSELRRKQDKPENIKCYSQSAGN